MNAEQYLKENQETIKQECETISNNGSKPIITLKENGSTYIYKIGTAEEFMERIPDNDFFKKMRDGVTNAISHRVVPIVVFQGKEAQLISLPDYFELKK